MNSVIICSGEFASLNQTIIFAVLLTVAVIIAIIIYKLPRILGLKNKEMVSASLRLLIAGYTLGLIVIFSPYVAYTKIAYNNITNTTILYSTKVGLNFAQGLFMIALVVFVEGIGFAILDAIGYIARRKHER